MEETTAAPQSGGAREKTVMPYLMADRYELPQKPKGGSELRGHDRVTGSEVVLRFVEAADTEDRIRMLREGKILMRIHHPTLMDVVDVLSEDGRSWVAFNLVPETGPTLAELLDGSPRIPIRRAVRIAADLAWGLSILHRERLVYGDLSPRRVHLARSGCERETARIAGMDRLRARAGGPQWEGRILPGDPEYLAPEQILGEDATRASDMYALGCIVYQMLTGRPPARGKNLVETVERALHVDGPEVFPSRFGVPRRVKGILKDLLRRNPDRRPEVSALLAERLESAWEWTRRLPWIR